MKELKNKASPSLLFGGGSFLLIFYKIIKLAKNLPKSQQKKPKKCPKKLPTNIAKVSSKPFFWGGVEHRRVFTCQPRTVRLQS